MGSDAWLYSILFYIQCIYTWVRIYTHIHTHIYIYNYICIHSHTYKIYVCIVFCKWNQKASKTRLTWLTCTGFTVNEIFIITGTFSWWNDVICCLACEAKEQKKTKVRYLQVKKLLQRQLNIQGKKRGFMNLTFKLFKLYQALHICPCKYVLHWVGVSCQSNSAYPVLLNISGVHRLGCLGQQRDHTGAVERGTVGCKACSSGKLPSTATADVTAGRRLGSSTDTSIKSASQKALPERLATWGMLRLNMLSAKEIYSMDPDNTHCSASSSLCCAWFTTLRQT